MHNVLKFLASINLIRWVVRWQSFCLGRTMIMMSINGIVWRKCPCAVPSPKGGMFGLDFHLRKYSSIALTFSSYTWSQASKMWTKIWSWCYMYSFVLTFEIVSPCVYTQYLLITQPPWDLGREKNYDYEDFYNPA